MKKSPLEPFKKDLGEIERHLETCLGCEHPLVQEVSRYIVFSGGKRIRPVLTVACARLFGIENDDDCYRLSVVPEYLHAASLLHDDVIDEGELRRGKLPAYKVWGNRITILSGDYLYARAIEIASSFGNAEIDAVIAKTVQKMSEGEIIQLVQSKDPDLTLDVYYSIIERKTGALIAASAMIGGLFAGAPKTLCKSLYVFGDLIGKAFQIVDDLLDYTGDENELGKGIGTELKEGKVTVPLIYAFKMSDFKVREKIKKILSQENISDVEVNWVRSVILSTGALEASFNEAKGHIDNAIKELNKMPESETVGHLVNLSKYILERRR